MILFFTEYIDFQLLRKNSWKNWIKEVGATHHSLIGEVNYIFCNDEYLLAVNQKYLNHDYFTDIITFPSDSPKNKISGDLFISIERVLEHSFINDCSFLDELKRVMIHGILHLLGYSDTTQEEKLIMRELENKAMSLFHVEQNREYYQHRVSRETK